jgi:L-ribulokinase
MESNKKYVIGLDFDTDSCRALVVDTYTGREMATGVSFYPRWKAGLYCDAHNNRYRQHPLDYIESMTEAVHIALSDLKEEEIASICGLCFDTTGSTPALTDKAGMPLALCPEFAEELASKKFLYQIPKSPIKTGMFSLKSAVWKCTSVS